MWLEELGVTERLVFYVFCAVAALDLVLALSVLVVGLIYRINTPGASLDFYIAFGSLALMVSTLIRGADPEWGTISQLESLCAFFPSILTFGLLWFIGGLLLKACAIQNYFKYHSGDSVRAHEWKPNFWMILLMIADAIIVMVWLLVYEPELIPRDPSGNQLAKNISMSGVEHYYTCEGDKFDIWMIGVSSLHGLLLLLAGIIVWSAVHNSRRTPASAEATLLSIAIYNTIFGVIGAALVYFYFDGSKSTTYAIIGGITFYIIFMTLLLILIMKVVAARRMKYSRGSRDNHYDKVDDDRGRNSYRHDNYINETQLPSKKSKRKKDPKKPKVKREKVKKEKVKREKVKKVKKEKKVKEKSRKSKASYKSDKSGKSKRSSGYHDRDNYENDRYESDRYDDHHDQHDHHDRASSRERGSNRDSYHTDSHRDGGHYNDSRGSGHDNRGYESNRTSKVYNDSRGSYREDRSHRDDHSDRGSYGRNSPEYRGSDRGSNRQSEVFAY